MIKYIKRLFCNHNYRWFYKSCGNKILHEKQWYYDDYSIGVCTKCKKEITDKYN